MITWKEILTAFAQNRWLFGLDVVALVQSVGIPCRDIPHLTSASPAIVEIAARLAELIFPNDHWRAHAGRWLENGDECLFRLLGPIADAATELIRSGDLEPLKPIPRPAAVAC